MKERIEAERLIIQLNAKPEYSKYSKVEKSIYTAAYMPSQFESTITHALTLTCYLPVAIWKIKLK